MCVGSCRDGENNVILTLGRAGGMLSLLSYCLAGFEILPVGPLVEAKLILSPGGVCILESLSA